MKRKEANFLGLPIDLGTPPESPGNQRPKLETLALCPYSFHVPSLVLWCLEYLWHLILSCIILTGYNLFLIYISYTSLLII